MNESIIDDFNEEELKALAMSCLHKLWHENGEEMHSLAEFVAMLMFNICSEDPVLQNKIGAKGMITNFNYEMYEIFSKIVDTALNGEE